MSLLLLLLLLADGASSNQAAVSVCHVVDVFSGQGMRCITPSALSA